MASRHQDYLYNSRRKRLTRIVRFGGGMYDATSKERSTDPNQRGSYPYYGLGDETRDEVKGYVVWLFMALPLIVLFVVFWNPIFGMFMVFLSLATVGYLFWRKHK